MANSRSSGFKSTPTKRRLPEGKAPGRVFPVDSVIVMAVGSERAAEGITNRAPVPAMLTVPPSGPTIAEPDFGPGQPAALEKIAPKRGPDSIFWKREKG